MQQPKAWPDNESTRRAEGSQRGRLAGGPPPTAQHGPTAGPDGARNTRGVPRGTPPVINTRSFNRG